MKQASVENLMSRLGSDRERSKNQRAKEKRQESITSHGRQLLRSSVAALSKEIREFCKTTRGPKSAIKEKLKLFDPEVAALLIARVVVDGVSSERTLTSLAFAVGRQLEDELRFSKLAEDHKGLWDFLTRTRRRSYKHFRERVLREMKRVGADFTPWTNKECIQLGVLAVELFAASTGIVRVDLRAMKKKRKRFVVATEETVAWMEEARKANEEGATVNLPMVLPPQKWEHMYGGGYLTGVVTKSSFVKPQAFSPYDIVGTMPVPAYHMEQVNRIQDTGWRINSYVLDVMSKLWDNSVEIADLPTRERIPVPEKPHDIGTNDLARKEYRKGCAKAHRENAAKDSARMLTSKHLYIANQFKDKVIWLPWFCDYRGRAYPLPHGIQPQGQQQARGLLYFADKVPIGTEKGMDCLARHGANAFGNDKLSYEERINWVYENEAEILKIANDPYEYTWWSKWDKPWEGLAFCKEWEEVKKHGLSYESGLVVSVDASNSGHQIYSLLLRDPAGALATNVLPNDTPLDLYSTVADAVTASLKNKAALGDPIARKWLLFCDGKIPRSATKRPTMVVVYSAKKYSALEYTAEWYREAVKERGWTPFEGEAYKECAYLADITWRMLDECVQGARMGMDWLRQVADVCTNSKIPVRWTSPSGFEVCQASCKTESEIITTKCGANVLRKSELRYPIHEFHPQKQRTGICPNYIHSLDAAAKMRTVDIAYGRGVRSFAMVHDSYGTVAGHMPHLERSLREAFAEIFSENQLENFAKEVQAYLPKGVRLPELPPMGDLDPKCVLDSPYFFS